MDKKYDVFISYSRKDSNIAEEICNYLDQSSISYFIDKRGIAGGVEFPIVLANAILESRVFLYLASNNSYESKFTRKEITFAFNKLPENCLLPYIIDDSQLPIELEFVFSSINWRSLSEHPIEVIVDDILKLLGRATADNSSFKTDNGFYDVVLVHWNQDVYDHNKQIAEELKLDLSEVISSLKAACSDNMYRSEQLKTIKALMSICGIPMPEARKQIMNSPSVISTKKTKDEAERIKRSLEEVGALVALKESI